MEKDRKALGREAFLQGREFQSQIAKMFRCTDLDSNFAPDLLCQRPCDIVRVEVKRRPRFTRSAYLQARNQPTNKQTKVYVVSGYCSDGAYDQAKADGNKLFCDVEFKDGQKRFLDFLKTCDD